MTLIEEIRNAAVDSKCDLGTLLRKCKVLASRLGSEKLDEWLIWESDGYPMNAQVPDYRIWGQQIKGHFAGPGGSQYNNAPIPMIRLPEDARKFYEKHICRLSITSIEEISKNNVNKNLVVSTGDLAILLRTNVYQGYNCIETWAEFSAYNFVEVLNTVRNHILDFSLALWKEKPLIGETSNQVGRELKPERVTQIFYTTVYGGAANLVGIASDTYIEFNVSYNDFESLERLLAENSVSVTDIKELQEALRKDDLTTSNNRFGPKVSAWIAKMMGKAADGSWQIGVGAAGTLLAQAISKYYGL